MRLLGSTCKVSYFSLLINQHCYKSNKIKMASSAGMDKDKWLIGYSDSMADIPMLERCVDKVLINVKPKKLTQFKSRLSGDVQERLWA
mgnify:FL=1